MNVKILVCYHKPSLVIANRILQPIFVGAKEAKTDLVNELENMCQKENVILLKDDAGGGVLAS